VTTRSEVSPAVACDGSSRATTFVFSGSRQIRATMQCCARRRGFSGTFCAAASCHAACRGMEGLRYGTITPCVLWRCAIAEHSAVSTPRLRVEAGHCPKMGTSGRGSSVSSRRNQPACSSCADKVPYADCEVNRNSAVCGSSPTWLMRDLPISACPRPGQYNPRRAPPDPIGSSISSSSTSGRRTQRLKALLGAAHAQHLLHPALFRRNDL
jgi:hypothetical protein